MLVVSEALLNGPLCPKIFSCTGENSVARPPGSLLSIPAHIHALSLTEHTCRCLCIFAYIHKSSHTCSFVLPNFPSNFILELQELLSAVGSLVFSGGKAEITEVSKCSGDVSSYNNHLAYKS